MKIVIDHEYDHAFAVVDPVGDFLNDEFIVYLGGRADTPIEGKFAHACGCENPTEYIEKYLEQILSHEAIHWVVFNVFSDDRSDCISACINVDRFDNWNLNPISFQSLTSKVKNDG